MEPLSTGEGGWSSLLGNNYSAPEDDNIYCFTSAKLLGALVTWAGMTQPGSYWGMTARILSVRSKGSRLPSHRGLQQLAGSPQPARNGVRSAVPPGRDRINTVYEPVRYLPSIYA